MRLWGMMFGSMRMERAFVAEIYRNTADVCSAAKRARMPGESLVPITARCTRYGFGFLMCVCRACTILRSSEWEFRDFCFKSSRYPDRCLVVSPGEYWQVKEV